MHDDYYDELHEVKTKLIKELVEHGKGEFTQNNLDVIDTCAHAAKNICKIMESIDEENYGYSNRMMPPYYRGNSYGNRSYDDRSYDNRGMSMRRDSMGRYSSNDEMLDELYATMNAAKDEATRSSIQRLINKMEGR